MLKILLVLILMLRNHYDITLTLHSVLSIAALSMAMAAFAPPVIPHLAVYVFTFWAGTGLLFCVYNADALLPFIWAI